MVNPTPMSEIVPPEGRPRLKFKEAVGICISKYATFTGRARRSEYWWFWVFSIIVMAIPLIAMAVVALVDGAKLPVEPDQLSESAQAIDMIFVVALVLIVLFLGIPSLAVQTRRLHDTGHSGWWLVWGILASLAFEITVLVVLGGAYSECGSIAQIKEAFGVSVFGAIVMLLFYLLNIGLSIAILIFALLDSERGENEYDESPKYQ